MLNEVKHLGREQEVSLVSEATCGGQILGFAQGENHHMTSDAALPHFASSTTRQEIASSLRCPQ
jgi:hypothetical protein